MNQRGRKESTEMGRGFVYGDFSLPSLHFRTKSTTGQAELSRRHSRREGQRNERRPTESTETGQICGSRFLPIPALCEGPPPVKQASPGDSHSHRRGQRTRLLRPDRVFSMKLDFALQIATLQVASGPIYLRPTELSPSAWPPAFKISWRKRGCRRGP